MQQYAEDAVSEHMQKLQKAFFDAVNGKNKKYAKWLTPVGKFDAPKTAAAKGAASKKAAGKETASKAKKK